MLSVFRCSSILFRGELEWSRKSLSVLLRLIKWSRMLTVLGLKCLARVWILELEFGHDGFDN